MNDIPDHDRNLRYIALANKALRYGWHLLSASEQDELKELHGEWMDAQDMPRQCDERIFNEAPIPPDD